MKALKLIVPLIIVISLSAVPCGIAKSNIVAASSDHIITTTVSTEPTAPITAKTVADGELIEGPVITDSNTLKSSIDSELPLSDDIS